MRRLADNVVLVAAVALMCIVCWPLFVFQPGVDWVRGRIQKRWPDSYRAQAVSFWIGLLAPAILCVVLTILLSILVAWEVARRSA